jgi:hypothetical protein
MDFRIGRFEICGIEQWSQFFQNCNWYTFDIAHIQAEDDKVFGDFEFRLVILGVGLILTWRRNTT